MHPIDCLLIPVILLIFVGLAAATTYDLPYVKRIKIDGEAAAWAEEGFRVGLLAWKGRLAEAKDLTAGFRAGWCDQGVVFLVDVVDDAFVEAPAGDLELWRRDSVQVLVSGLEGRPRCELLVAPGMDPRHPKPRVVLLHDARPVAPDLAAQVRLAVRPRKDGYRMELLLPWSALGGRLAKGATMRLTLIVNDCDRGRDRFAPRWSTGKEGRLRLAATASPPQDLVIAKGVYEKLRHPVVQLATVAELIDKPVSVRAGGRELAAGRIESDGPRGKASLRLKTPAESRPGRCELVVGDDVLATMSFPHLDALRARAVAAADYDFGRYVFTAEAFPRGALGGPDLHAALGRFEVKVTFLDARHRPVTKAAAPGRYGAVVELAMPDGRVMRRFRTLCRLPEQIKPGDPVETIFKKLGHDPAVLGGPGRGHRRLLSKSGTAGFAEEPGSAMLVAGLMDASAQGLRPGSMYDIEAIDRKWWLAQKRHIYGWDRRFTEPLQRPEPIERSKGVRTLREGGPTEAGMKADAVKTIDAVCRRWQADSNEAFGVCIARHGVVFFHRAYGRRDGAPMKLTDKSSMASSSKPMGGLLMMMLLDQGLVGLDDDIGKYLPPFAGRRPGKPVTIRHLYTHTADINGHAGHDVWDLSERVAAEYEHLQVGKRFEYASRDYTIAGRIIEAVTGETVPELYRKRLIEPLELARTDAGYMGFGFRSTPMDYAIIGQMMLNRGAYGRRRFFSKETFEKMLPVSLEPLLGRKTDDEWGMGVRWYTLGGVARAGIGHQAASMATFRVDLAHDMVLVMTRNTGGKNFAKHYRQFMQAVYSCLVDESN